MKVAFHTLGCKVNQYETQAMIEQFKGRGHQVVAEDCFADAYIINTCSVTNLADRKSRQYIRRMKKVNPDSIMAVTGCYAQISGEEVIGNPQVDIVIGMNEKHLIVDHVEELAQRLEEREKKIHVLSYDQLTDYVETGSVISMESRTRAYIKVQEGCNRFCSYCIIPYARGKVRSRKVENVVDEAKGLITAGFKELILTGINTALYGMEEGFDYLRKEGEENVEGIEILIKRISEIPGEFRIRLSSLEPTVINGEYVKRLFAYPKLCHHLHLSIQSGSDHVLKLMNRNYGRDEYMEIVRSLKDFDPNYGITTDIIVGFPGESEEDFADSLDMVERTKFCKVHAFQYSKRPGTKAVELPGHIAGPVKKERSEELIRLSEEMTQDFFLQNQGTERVVLFEEHTKEEDYITGYTDNYIRVYVKRSENDLELGQLYRVQLDEPFRDGMIGRVIHE